MSSDVVKMLLKTSATKTGIRQVRDTLDMVLKDIKVLGGGIEDVQRRIGCVIDDLDDILGEE